MKNALVFMLLCMLMVVSLVSGCAGQSAVNTDMQSPVANIQTPPDPQQNIQPAAEKKDLSHRSITLAEAQDQQKKVIEQDGQEYDIIKTPVGWIKRPHKQNDNNIPKTPVAPASAGVNNQPKPVIKTETPLKPNKPEKSISTTLSPQKDQQETHKEEAVPKDPKNNDKQGHITLNFDDADLYEVIHTFSKLLNFNYMMSQNIRGSVTIHTVGDISQQDLFPLFFQILEANGLTAVKEGKLYKIDAIQNATHMQIQPHKGTNIEGLSPSERILIQLVSLKYIKPEEMIKIITPFISTGGQIVSHNKTLMIIDKGINIIRILKLIETFDVDVFKSIQQRFFALKYEQPAKMIETINTILQPYKMSEDDIRLIPIDALNMVLVMSKIDTVFPKIEEIIKMFDIPDANVEPRIYLYFVKNGKAEELAPLLSEIFGQTEEKEEGKKTTPAGKNDKAGQNDKPLKSIISVSSMGNKGQKQSSGNNASDNKAMAITGKLSSEIRIITDTVRNALIIKATPADYQQIKTIMASLDKLPRQVLIEVTIAEIQHNDAMDLGVEWKYNKHGAVENGILNGSAGSGGLGFALGINQQWQATFSALAQKNKINILSKPNILASDNKTANISISQEIPIASSQYQYGGTSDSSVTQTNIQYRNTGIILAVTPHINEHGMVSMEINQEVSDSGGDVQVAGTAYPSFFNRSVQTSLTVQDGQTIIMGGLVKKQKDKTKNGVPFLSSLPWIGFLFGKHSDTNIKQELILMITPHVVTSVADIDSISKEFEQRIDNTLGPGKMNHGQEQARTNK